MKKINLKKLLNKLNGSDEKILEDFKAFDTSISKLKSQLKEKIQVATLDEVNDKIENFRKKIDFSPLQESFEQIKTDILDRENELKKILDDKLGEIQQELSNTRTFNKSNINSLMQELSNFEVQVKEVSDRKLPEFPDFLSPIKDSENRLTKMFKSDIESLTKLDKSKEFKKQIDEVGESLTKLRTELFSKINEKGGGSMNRKINFDSTNYLTKYTDINFKAGSNVTLSAVNNTTTKMVDVTISSTGGTVGPGTANEIAYFDTTTSIASLSVATYPSLIELSYVKGVTSAIQTQINAKFTLPSLTSGSVLFYNGTTIAQDNANFFWDDTNNRLGIGTTSPNHLLSISSASAGGTVLGLYNSLVQAGNRNWAIATNQNVYGDFSIMQSNADAGNPISAGTARLYIDLAGNVGIGTTGPTSKLEIARTGATNAQLLTLSDDGTSGISNGELLFNNTGTGGIDFGVGHILNNTSFAIRDLTNTGSPYRVLIDTNGNVGIGTTAPGTKLSVVGGDISFGDAATAYSRLSFNSNSLVAGVINRGTAAADLYFGESTDTGKYIFRTSGATTFEGNVGIGTTGPGAKLHVVDTVAGGGVIVENTGGAAQLKIKSNGSYEFLTFFDGATQRGLVGSSGVGTFIVGSSNNEPVNFYMNNAAKMVIDTTGNVGIGTTNPGAKLSVQGEAAVGALAGTYVRINGIGDGRISVGSNLVNDNLVLDAKGSSAVLVNYDAGTGGLSVFGGTTTQQAQIGGTGNSWINTGNVGIGTTAPGEKLQIGSASGNVWLSGGGNFMVESGMGMAYALGGAGESSVRLSSGVTLKTSNTTRVTVDSTGNVGIGTTSPTAVLHLKAGTTAASTAPLKFTSGSLLTTAEAGAIEFLTDAFYATITTGAARKTFAFLEAPVFTTSIQTPTIELGHATDTTLARVSAGVISVEGARVITSAGTTANTILKNNGTTFVASTETYAAPGTSGNVMTSDGTNWTSAAPAGGSAPTKTRVSTAFETSARFGGANSGTSSARTFDANGLSNGAGSTSGGYSYSSFTVVGGGVDATSKIHTGNSQIGWSGAINISGDGDIYFGTNDVGFAGGINYATVAQYGFKVVRSGGVITLYATNSNGTTQTATSLTTFTDGDSLDLVAVKTGTTQIDFYYRLNAATQVLGATHTTNLPSASTSSKLYIGARNGAVNAFLNPVSEGMYYER